MLFGRKAATVAAPSVQLVKPEHDAPGTEATPSEQPKTEPGAAPAEGLRPTAALRELEHAIAELSDEQKWLRERFEKLQNRVTAELREIRREVDRLEDAYSQLDEEEQD